MQPCPRQSELFAVQTGNSPHWREDGTCSYCGSISEELLFKSIELGIEVGPTDKNYKVYCDVIDPDEGQMKVVGVSNEKENPGDGWVPADTEILLKNGFGLSIHTKWMKLTPRTRTKFGKFYFQHLSLENQQRFITLLNDKKIKIGYPGYFYVLPFFMRTVGVRSDV